MMNKSHFESNGVKTMNRNISFKNILKTNNVNYATKGIANWVCELNNF